MDDSDVRHMQNNPQVLDVHTFSWYTCSQHELGRYSTSILASVLFMLGTRAPNVLIRKIGILTSMGISEFQSQYCAARVQRIHHTTRDLLITQYLRCTFVTNCVTANLVKILCSPGTRDVSHSDGSETSAILKAVQFYR